MQQQQTEDTSIDEEIPPELLAKIVETFKKTDIDGEGFITGDIQLATAIAMCNMNTDEAEIETVLEKLGLIKKSVEREDIKIDLKHFKMIVKDLDAREDLRQAFAYFDTKNDKSISKEMLGKILEGMTDDGVTFESGELQKMIDAADTDGDGKIDIDEFVAFMMSV